VFIPLSDYQLVEYNAALLSICMVVLLGFADDFVDLKWRYKLIVPTIATFPLLVAYKGLTSVIMPVALRPFFGQVLQLGIIYKIYMGSLAVFATNAINIYAGINGIEVG
jgi:UDP-N-acetylglucosamine--dolichyl-phosphate N-acetylglucosaminephosphotransferase